MRLRVLLLKRHSGTFRALMGLIVLAFFLLGVSAARHQHRSTEAEIQCAVCVAAAAQADGLTPAVQQAEPAYVLLYAVAPAVEPAAPPVAALALPPSCGPPQLS